MNEDVTHADLFEMLSQDASEWHVNQEKVYLHAVCKLILSDSNELEISTNLGGLPTLESALTRAALQGYRIKASGDLVIRPIPNDYGEAPFKVTGLVDVHLHYLGEF